MTAHDRVMQLHLDRIKLEVGALESTMAARADDDREEPYWSCEHPGGCACGCDHVPGACEYCHLLDGRDTIAAQLKESHVETSVSNSKQKTGA